jgi:hypothetical protein
LTSSRGGCDDGAYQIEEERDEDDSEDCLARFGIDCYGHDGFCCPVLEMLECVRAFSMRSTAMQASDTPE